MIKLILIISLMLTGCSCSIGASVNSEENELNEEGGAYALDRIPLRDRIWRYENREVICYQYLESLQCKFKETESHE